jgi:Flp pilus assembly protein CpaB
LKRSNRLILLVGLFLAVVAFVGIYLLLSGPRDDGDGASRTEGPAVFATKDIPLGVEVQADMVENRTVSTDSISATAFADVSLVIGKIARTDIATGKQLEAADFTSGSGIVDIQCPPTKRCIAVQVDQVTGVGTLIKAGDYVDMVVGFTGDKFPVVTIDPNTDAITPVAGLNTTSVRLLLQGIQVAGVLLPPPPADGQQTDGETPTNLTGQQEIVILAADFQQTEIIKFAQLDGSMSLVLRSVRDFQDPNNPGVPVQPIPDAPSGITLRELVDTYGVLIPEVIEAVLPTEATP